jgi:hypothetical protein
MIHFVVTKPLEHVVREYLDYWGRDVAPRMRVLHYEELPQRRRFEPGTYVLSGFELLSPGMLRLVTEIHGALAGRPGLRLLNDPARTLGRYELLTALHDRGWNDFRVARAGGDLAGLRYPVFLRAERSHDGAVSPLLHSPKELDEAIGRALLAGRRLKDLLAVEFCDTRNGTGWYRKYAAFVVGNRVLARSLDHGQSWMIKHERTTFTAEHAASELAFVTENPHARELAAIRRVAGVEYGRIDYGVRDGRVQTWEINLIPSIGRGLSPTNTPKPPEVEAIRRETKRRFYAAFREALEAVDLAPDGLPAVAVNIDPAIVRAARSRALTVPSPAGHLVRWLEPARPVLEPVAVRVLPFLGRLARRAAARRR